MASMVAFAFFFFFLVGSMSNAAVVEHTFVVSQVGMRRLGKEMLMTVVNGQLPGPTIEAEEGDSVVVHVVNQSPYGVTIHWHGVRQRFNCWADGAGMITQCPISPNATFTYRFDVAGQEGTLWWHSHVDMLRATLHGAIIIRPKSIAGNVPRYPFQAQPDEEVPIVIADFWEVDLMKLAADLSIGGPMSYFPTAATINGMTDSFVLDVHPGKTYMLRLVNAALYSEYYFKVAGHRLTVVGADASYVRPYTTDGAVAVAPGETLDLLMLADAPTHRSYYMVILGNQPPVPSPQMPLMLARGTVRYPGDPLSSFPQDPAMPDQHDCITSFNFHGNLTGRPDHPLLPQIRGRIDHNLFITLSMGTLRNRSMDAANMNNVSFRVPSNDGPALLQARYHGLQLAGVATEDLPAVPPVPYNFTDMALMQIFNRTNPRVLSLEPTRRATTTRRFAYNSTVEVVFQSTSLLQDDPNPIHLHGHNFFVLAQGHGNYHAARDVPSYNLVDPPVKNTVMVPSLGWAAVRFVADNPGAWFVHCHYAFHMGMGMATVFEVANGPTPDTMLPPPPADLPVCGSSLAY